MRPASLAAAVAIVIGVFVTAPSALAAGPAGNALFVQAAEGGGFHDGVLTLRGVSRQVAWFTDRPERDSGTVSFGVFRKALFSGHQSAPNAALDVAGQGLGGVAALRLSKPTFDAQRNTVSYRVKRLKKASGNLDHYVGRLSKRDLPRSFGPASLFIDNALGMTCFTTVIDSTSYALQSVSASKWSTDTWDPALPLNFGIGQNESWNWGSQGGAFRGCSNSAVWQLYAGASGTISFSTTNPFSGAPTFSCVSSNTAVRCNQISSDDETGSVTWSIVAS